MTDPQTPVLPTGLPLNDFDPNTRPQDDLYRHVNGLWAARTEIPEDKARWGSFNALAEQAERDVREIVEATQNAPEGSEERKVGDLYASFMNTDAVEAASTAPLEPIFERIDAISSVPELLTTLGEFDREGLGHVIGVYAVSDPGNPGTNTVFISQSGLSLPDESYYREDEFAPIREAYDEHLVRFAALTGIDPADAAAATKLEHDIAATHWDNVKTRDAVASYNPTTWDELQVLAGVDLTPWARAVAPANDDAFANSIVRQPSFVEGLGKLLTEDRLDEWKAWLRVHAAHSLAPYLSDDVVNENFAFYGTVLSGVPQIRERWKRGVQLAEGALGDVVGRAYVEQHFPAESKEQMEKLVANLTEAYRESITNLDWMTPETREKALEKLSKFRAKIGYPDEWRTYEDLEVDASDLVGNVRRANVFEHDYQLGKIGKPVDPNEWHMPPQMVNAYYSPLTNEIVFPAAILQYPFFDPNRDDAANYGGIGSVIGHEIGHGFDDQGSQFDGDGRLTNWWTDADREAFEQRTAALIEQYNALSPEGADGKTVNGELTIGENIGDLGGLGIALKAYALSLGSDAAPELDGYTGVQRLLLSWANVWQQKSRPAETVRLLAIDPHSPAEFRCNQIARNIDAFYEAFDVQPADALWLDPADRVTIW